MSGSDGPHIDSILLDDVRLKAAYEDLSESISRSVQHGVLGEDEPGIYHGGVFLRDEGNRIFKRAYQQRADMRTGASITRNHTEWNDRYEHITRQVYVMPGGEKQTE